MKTILFVRHGKSAWGNNLSDIDRPLNKRGQFEAKIIAKAFHNKNIDLDKVYCSTANRTRSTCKIFKEICHWSDDLIIEDSQLYDFTGEKVLDFIHNLSSQINNVLIFGHNHGFTSLINTLGDFYIDNLPTSGLVAITFDIDKWKFANFGKTELIMFPRDFREAIQ